MAALFGSDLTIIPIRPQSYDVPQRVEASVKATELRQGLRMEVGNMTTKFYADPKVPIGKVAVYAPPSYKAMLEYVTTLDSPTDHWLPKGTPLLRKDSSTHLINKIRTMTDTGIALDASTFADLQELIKRLERDLTSAQRALTAEMLARANDKLVKE